MSLMRAVLKKPRNKWSAQPTTLRPSWTKLPSTLGAYHTDFIQTEILKAGTQYESTLR